MIKVGESNKGVEGRAIDRAVTVRCHIVADVFDPGFEKVAFGQTEGDAILLEYFAHAFEQQDIGLFGRGPEQDIVDDDATTSCCAGVNNHKGTIA
eukprot:scaffold85103_cov48-Attheya_sp.AAC.2